MVYFNNHLVRLELAKRAWQQTDLAREARLSEPTVRRSSAAVAYRQQQR